MEATKRKHRRTKTAAQIKQEIEALQVELERREKEERLKIGQKMQEWAGAETWDEIEAILRGSRATKPETITTSFSQSGGQGTEPSNSEGR